MQGNKAVYSVKQVNQYIKRIIEEDFVLNNIYIKGEISNCKYHYSGHIYFSLKDESGVISAVMFASNARGLAFQLENGMQVVVFGTISVYERDGRYQLYVKQVERDGQGNLFRHFEELKKRLEESGMFDPLYKKPIPRFSMNIGVVTAETGAVIRDIYNVAVRRNPYCRITLYPARVQGEGAGKTICEGIRVLDQMSLDVIIIGRGGGSIEDLWAFNEEEVARTIFHAQTPIISAVGHETDFTIADFVADLRAPTPSAAAELAVFDYARFENDLGNYAFQLRYQINHRIRLSKERLQNCRLKLDLKSPQNQLYQKMQFLQDAVNKMNEIMNRVLSDRREQMIRLGERLEGLSPLQRLKGGYAFVTSEDGETLKSVRQIHTGDKLTIHISDGSIHTAVEEIQAADMDELYRR